MKTTIFHRFLLKDGSEHDHRNYVAWYKACGSGQDELLTTETY